MTWWRRKPNSFPPADGLRGAGPSSAPLRRAVDRRGLDVPVDPTGFVVELDHRLAEVERQITAAVGDRSLCDLSKAGEAGGVKNLEGRMTVLAEARRAIRRGKGSTEDVVRHLLDEWRTELENDARRGPTWLTYRAGGVEELERLVRVLESR